MTGALLRYRVMAWVTGVFLLILTIWAIAGYAVLGYGDWARVALLHLLDYGCRPDVPNAMVADRHDPHPACRHDPVGVILC